MKTLETIPVTPTPAVQDLSGLATGLDYYKPTMSQLAYEQHPDAEVTFTYHNRGAQRLADYVDPTELQERFDEIGRRGWQTSELAYLASQRNSAGEPVFSTDYLTYLDGQPLPPVDVRIDKNTDDLAIETTGKWPIVTFWETVVMSQINETYFDNFMTKNGINVADIYNEGDCRLSDKLAILRQNPQIKFADFSTRRRFSLAWERHILERCLSECPDNLDGTSNVALATEFGIKPIGTFAHEMPMVYAGIARARGQDIVQSHGQMLDDWYGRYGKDLSIALTDTFTTDFFFRDFGRERAGAWRGLRQDSGDPFAFGEKAIKFYQNNGIDPREKTIVFSDSLDINKMVKLSKQFQGRIGIVDGWGGGFGSDMGFKNLNCVMKATHVLLKLAGDPLSLEADTVKLSDDHGKHTGPGSEITFYQRAFELAA